MKYNLTIELDQPIDRVIELFDNFENMKHWQEGFVSYEPLEGTPGEPGAKTRLKYKMGRREIEMVETIVERNLPEVFTGVYEAKGVWNEVRNHFVSLSPEKTKWESEVDFRFTSFFMKMMGFFMPGAFKKQSFKYMKDFKKFVEAGK